VRKINLWATGANSAIPLSQAYAASYVVWVISAKSGLPAGNMNYNTQNEERISIYIIIYNKWYLLICLHVMFSKNAMITIRKVHKNVIHNQC